MSQHTYSTSSPSPHHSSLATSRLIAFSGGDYHLSGAAGSSALACGCGQGNCYGTTVHQHCSNTMSNAGNCSSSPSTPLRNSDGSDSLGWSNGESDHVCAGTGSGSMAGALSTAATLSSVVHQKRFRAQGRLSNAIANSKNGSDGCCCWLPGDANSAKSSHFSLHAKTPDSSCKSTPSTRPGTHLTTPASSATHHKGTALNEAASSDSATVRKALDQWFGVSSASDSGNASMRVDVAGMPADQSVGAAAGLPFLERGGSVGSGGVAPCSGTSVSCRSFCRGASSDLKKASDPTKSSGTSRETLHSSRAVCTLL
ncbi:protein kinase domain protein [Cystoisospora suis]|uniref:Protein kinase domain protein n=1 Tax=Cystoisospora suis TaxID=483139 RepID=A0A2C6KP87_9APIC|nr:protein kinase domain protein [Cystoisospora suis]